MKLLHISDEHIRERDIDEIAICLNFIVETAKAEVPDLIISAGDLFDSQDVKMGSRSALAAIGFISALADVAPVAIVIGTPSHDGKAPEILRFARGKYDIRVASSPIQYLLYQQALYGGPLIGNLKPEAVITLVPTPTKQFFQTTSGIEGSDQEIGHAMSGLFTGFGAQAAQYPGVTHILVGHWNVNGCRLANGQIRTGMDIEVSVDQMNMGGFDLGCLGHIHKAQTLGEKYFYSGPIYSTRVDEEGPMGFYIHVVTAHVDGVAVVSEFIETPCRKTVRVQQDLTSPDCQSRTIDAEGAHVRIDLTEWQDLAGKIDKAALETFYKEQGALSVDIRINAVPRVNVRAESVLAATTLREEIKEMAKLRGEEIDPDVLLKAELLENTPGEELMERIVGGGA